MIVLHLSLLFFHARKILARMVACASLYGTTSRATALLTQQGSTVRRWAGANSAPAHPKQCAGPSTRVM